jgi:hypothetical protein
MNAKLRQYVLSLPPLCLVFFVSSSYGQGHFLPNLQILQAQIDKQKELAAGWESLANIEFFLAMLVVVLGAVVALLQKVDGKKWCSYVVAVSGIAISILTFATKECFEVDHKTYRKNATTARREISNAEIYLAAVNKPDIDSQDRQDLLVEVVKSISKIKSIAESIEKTSSVVASSKNSSYFEFIKTAYAQTSSRPAWVSQTRTENSTSYRFLGVGTAPSVAAAQSQALLSAQNAAASGLPVPLDIVKQYSILVDTYLEYDAGRRIYLCYAMVELNKAFVHR